MKPRESECMERWASISTCGLYRYTLNRWWGRGEPSVLRSVGFVMLNPSTADAERDDPTIRRCVGFARSWGYDGIVVVNVFAYRTPSPAVLVDAWRDGVDVVGPLNRDTLEKLSFGCQRIVAAWGAPKHAMMVGEMGKARVLLPDAFCLGRTKQGHPRHPLYVKGDVQPVRMRVGREQGDGDE